MLCCTGGAQSYGVSRDKGAATVSQMPKPKKRQNGVQLAVQILQKEGVRGLYRGFGASIATFVPSSAIWCANIAEHSLQHNRVESNSNACDTNKVHCTE